jgi:hypothetical protein
MDNIGRINLNSPVGNLKEIFIELGIYFNINYGLYNDTSIKDNLKIHRIKFCGLGTTNEQHKIIMEKMLERGYKVTQVRTGSEGNTRDRRFICNKL